MSRIITIVCTKHQLGIEVNDTVGEYGIIDKESLMKRLDELTDEGMGYTILIATMEGHHE